MHRTFGALTALATWLTACGGAAPAATSPASPASIAFVGVSVPSLNDGAPRAGEAEQTVVVRGDRIAAIGPWSRVRLDEGTKVIDGRGKTLLPGLVDMHVHLVHAAHLPLYVARGVTTVRNMWGAPIHLTWRREIEAGRRLGPTIRTAGPIVDGADPVHEGSFVAATTTDADRAIALHVASGFDFVKAYAKLSPEVFEHLVTGARARGIAVVGHVPREVGLLRALDGGLASVEHTNTFYDALQADDSPVRGKTDRASRLAFVDHLDASKLPSIAARFVASHAFACPTRVVMRSWESADAQRRWLARPEVERFILPSDRAIWAPDGEVSEAEQARDARELAIADATVRALHRGGVTILAGTDTSNPLLVPGYALHDELAELVRLGLTPREALRAATGDAARALGMSDVIGSVTEGKRADLLLVDGDPTIDITATTHIAGVMTRGRFIDPAASERRVQSIEAWARGDGDPFADRPPLEAEVKGQTELAHARYRVFWKDTPFDTERLLVVRDDAGERTIVAESFDPHDGAWVRMTLELGPSGLGDHLVVDADGAIGRGRLDVRRDGASLHVTGTSLSGDATSIERPIDPAAYLVADRFLASKLVVAPFEGAREVDVIEIGVGSAASLVAARWKLTAQAEAPGAIQLDTGRGAPAILEVPRGELVPTSLSTRSHGASLVWRRQR